MRAGACLRMTLECERRLVGSFYTLQGAIEQRPVGGLQVCRQACFIYSETMVLTGDGNCSIRYALHRVVGTMMAKTHLHRAGTAGQRQNLTAQTDAENRQVGLQKFAGCGNCALQSCAECCV